MRTVPFSELELLLLAARLHFDESQSERISAVLARGIDWSGVESLANRHGLLPLVLRTLLALDSPKIPPHALAKSRSLCEANRVHNLILVGELLRALRALESAGVTAVPYKGPALAQYLLGDFTLRQASDIDLLVKPSDARKACHILIEQGFVSARRVPALAQAAYVRLHCVFTFGRLGHPFFLDLNWRVAPVYWGLPDILDSAWARLRTVSVAGLDVHWFVPEDLLVLLCVHGCKHKWGTMKWIVDVAELLRRHPDLDWQGLLRNARLSGATRMLFLGLYIANDLFDAPLPSEVLDSVRRNPVIDALAAEVYKDLFVLQTDPIDASTTLRFLVRATERWSGKLCCTALIPAYFLLNRVVRPGMASLLGERATN
jgi:hypothetical protein